MKFIITEDQYKRIVREQDSVTGVGIKQPKRMIKTNDGEEFNPANKGHYDATNRSNQDLQAIVNEIGKLFVRYYNGEKVNPRDTDHFCGDGSGNGPLSSKFKLVGDNNCINLLVGLVGFVEDNNPDLSKSPFNLKRPKIPSTQDALGVLKKKTYSLSQVLDYIGVAKNKILLNDYIGKPNFADFFLHQNNIYKNNIGIFVSLPTEFMNSLKNIKQNKFRITY